MPSRTNGVFMTESEYLAFEDTTELRHEFVDGYVFAMCDSTVAHSLICCDLIAFFHGCLKKAGFRVFSSKIKLYIESVRRYYYPDVIVEYGPLVPDSQRVESPVLVVEILSPGTDQIDCREKLVAYEKIPSLTTYLVVWQDFQQVEAYTRGADNHWVRRNFTVGESIQIELGSYGELCLPLSTIYAQYDPSGSPEAEEGEAGHCT